MRSVNFVWPCCLFDRLEDFIILVNLVWPATGFSAVGETENFDMLRGSRRENLTT